MRYTNWDVLLFPEGSKVPLQEFQTSCYVTEDPDLCQMKILPEELLLPSPTVTSFIPNLPLGHPFRVSLHSWEPPVATRATTAMAVNQNREVHFEARVLLDGICVAASVLGHQSSWPQVIDTLSHPAKAGDPEPLRFPPFHKELLTQSWWNAGETKGRIKVIIAEGLAHGFVPVAFERTRNVVSFSFQHAPLHILEDSKVAWPHPGMWCAIPQQLYNLNAPHDYCPVDADVHDRSPRSRGKDISDLTHADIARIFLAPPPSRTPGIRSEFDDSFLPAMTSIPDPFTDCDNFGMCGASNGYEGSEDQYVPDRIHSITPASKNQFDELVASLSTRKDITGGLLAPANTRASSAANTPPKHSGAFVETEWRAFAHSHGIPRPLTLTARDTDLNASQESSDVNNDSGTSESWSDVIEQPGLRVQMSPTKDVKGRKEGMSKDLDPPFPKPKRSLAADPFRRSGKENREGSAQNPFIIGDGKRKRSNTSSNSMPHIHRGGGDDSAPTPKVIRTEWEQDFSGSTFGDMYGGAEH